jgi:hypothetical protein
MRTFASPSAWRAWKCEAVIVEEHRDRDPKEAAYRRHEAIMARAPAAVPLDFGSDFVPQSVPLGPQPGADYACESGRRGRRPVSKTRGRVSESARTSGVIAADRCGA